MMIGETPTRKVQEQDPADATQTLPEITSEMPIPSTVIPETPSSPDIEMIASLSKAADENIPWHKLTKEQRDYILEKTLELGELGYLVININIGLYNLRIKSLTSRDHMNIKTEVGKYLLEHPNTLNDAYNFINSLYMMKYAILEIDPVTSPKMKKPLLAVVIDPNAPENEIAEARQLIMEWLWSQPVETLRLIQLSSLELFRLNQAVIKYARDALKN